MNTKFSIIDLNASGKSKNNQKIIEIALINFDSKKKTIENIFHSTVNPENYIIPDITRLTGVTNLKAMDAPYFYNIARKIVELTDERTIVTYNASTTYTILKKEFEELGFHFKRDVLSLGPLAQEFFPKITSTTFESLCIYFGSKQNYTRHGLLRAECYLDIFKAMLATKKFQFALQQTVMQK